MQNKLQETIIATNREIVEHNIAIGYQTLYLNSNIIVSYKRKENKPNCSFKCHYKDFVDGIHVNEKCGKKWAERLIKLLASHGRPALKKEVPKSIPLPSDNSDSETEDQHKRDWRPGH